MYGNYAMTMFSEQFRNAYYVGRFQVDKDPKKKPYKFYYIGHSDVFGVAMSEVKNKWDFQIWGVGWILGRSTKLDSAVADALNGKFVRVRHNVQLGKRAKKHGYKFVKPTRLQGPQTATEKKEQRLPLRKSKRKRTRRELKV